MKTEAENLKTDIQQAIVVWLRENHSKPEEMKIELVWNIYEIVNRYIEEGKLTHEESIRIMTESHTPEYVDEIWSRVRESMN